MIDVRERERDGLSKADRVTEREREREREVREISG